MDAFSTRSGGGAVLATPRVPRTGIGGALPMIEASASDSGMAMFDEDGGYDVVATVRQVTLDRPVCDIDVAQTRNFIVNGIITHNGSG
jgi:hypothetical protein